MTDPYRPVPEASERRPLSICVWCKHSRYAIGPWPECHHLRTIDPVRGPTKVVADPKIKNRNGNCPDYAPSLITRIFRKPVYR